MKIVHLTSVHSALDVRILHKEAATAAAAGHEVVLVAPAERDGSERGVRIRAVRQGQGRWRRITGTVLAVLRAALAERADVYHFHDPELIPAGLWLKLTGTRVVYDVHENLPAQVLSKDWISPWLRRPVAGAVAVLEAVSARLFDGIVIANPTHGRRFPPTKTTVVRNLPSLTEFPAVVAREWRETAVVYIGDLTRVRGAEDMVRAMALLPDRLDDARLWLVGRFSEPGLEAACRALRGWARVDFLGWRSRPEVAELLGRARVGLAPLHPVANYLTNYPTKVFEYMAAGLPTVASDLPPAREIVTGAACGLLVAPRDPAALAQAVAWLLERPDEAVVMGRRGRVAVETRLNWATEAAALLAIYDRLKVGPPSPAVFGLRKRS